MEIKPHEHILEQYLPFLTQRARFKVALSGRASGRSVNSTRAALFLMLQHRDLKVLCAREYMNSIADSSYAEIIEQIKALKLEKFFRILKTTILCPATNGAFIFKGIQKNIESIKSTTGIAICIVEEAATVSMEAFDMLFPTIRANGSEVWILGNPNNPMEATSQLFLENEPPPDTIMMSSNYDLNPFVSESMLIQIDHMRRTDYNRYLHVYCGQYMEMGDNNIFPLSDIQSATNRIHDIPSGIVKAGLDVAAEGDDYMVLMIMQGDRVIHHQSWHYTPDEVKFADQLIPILYHYKVDVIGIDSVGIGHGLVSVVKNRYKDHSVIGVDCRRKAGSPTYAKLKDEMMGQLQERIRDSLSIPNCKELIEDLQVSRFTYNSNDEWVVVGKKELKKKHGFHRSTDWVDALAIANWVTMKKTRDLTKIASRS